MSEGRITFLNVIDDKEWRMKHLKTSKRGRPYKDYDKKKSKALHIRMTQKQYDALKKSAKDNNTSMIEIVYTALFTIGLEEFK